jgi:hypothetical protein
VVSFAATENKGELESRENQNTERIGSLEIKTGSCDHDLIKRISQEKVDSRINSRTYEADRESGNQNWIL